MWCLYVTGGGCMDARLTVSTMRSACQFVQLSACLRHVSGRKRYPQKVRKPLCPLHFRSMVIPTGSRAPACAVTTDVRTHGTCASMRQGIMQHILRRQSWPCSHWQAACTWQGGSAGADSRRCTRMRAALIQLGRAVWLVHLHLIRVLSALLQHMHEFTSFLNELTDS